MVDTTDNQEIKLNIESYNICSEDFKGLVNHLIINLKIIQNINKCDKLSIIDNNFIIDDGTSYFQGVYRWWNVSSRENTLNELTKILDKLNNIISFLKNKLKDMNKVRTMTNTLVKKKELINKYIDDISKELPKSIEGITNLKDTYNDDDDFKTKLDIIIKGFNIE